MFCSSRCQPLNLINVLRQVSVLHLLHNISIDIGFTPNKHMFNDNVKTLSQNIHECMTFVRNIFLINTIWGVNVIPPKFQQSLWILYPFLNKSPNTNNWYFYLTFKKNASIDKFSTAVTNLIIQSPTGNLVAPRDSPPFHPHRTIDWSEEVT